MAIVQNPIVGRAIGKVANSVFTKWKGRNIWKSKAISVANPQTDGQLKQRARFSIVVRLASILLSILRVGMKEQATTKTESNAFTSINQRNGFLAWVTDAWVQDFSKLEISKGSLDTTDVYVTAVTAGDEDIVLTFDNDASGNQSLGDDFNVVVLNGEDVVSTLAGAIRSAGAYTVGMPNAVASGDVINILTFFSSADGKKSSNNTNTTITVA